MMHAKIVTARDVIRAAAALVVLTGITMPVARADWEIQPALSVGGEADDNAALDPITEREADISGLLLEADVDFRYQTETSEFSARPRLLSRDYGEPLFDSDDQFFYLDFSRDTQFTNFTFDGAYERELVRTAERLDTEFDIEDPDEIPVDASTRVDIRDRRERIELKPEFTYRVSNISSIGLELQYIDVTYDENIADVLNDYTNVRGTVDYRRDWSRRSTAVVEGTYRQYEAGDRDDVTGAGLSAGFETRLSETTRFRALVGVEDTELDTGENETNWVANISLVRRLQTITMIAQYRRVIAGGGGGSLTARDMLNLNFRRDLNDRISAALGVRAYTTSALEEGVVTIDERDYLQLRAQFVWRLSPTFDVEANYRYSILNRDLIGESANSNNVTLWFHWRPQPL